LPRAGRCRRLEDVTDEPRSPIRCGFVPGDGLQPVGAKGAKTETGAPAARGVRASECAAQKRSEARKWSSQGGRRADSESREPGSADDGDAARAARANAGETAT